MNGDVALESWRRSRAIGDEVNDICGVLNAQHARLVDLVIELAADVRLWQGDGVWTLEAYLSWRCGLHRATATKMVTIAARVEDLPECIDRFRRGELSLDQMVAIAKRAPWWIDTQLAGGLGPAMTVSQLSRTLSTYPFPEFDEFGREVRQVERESESPIGECTPDDEAGGGDDVPALGADPSNPDAKIGVDESLSFSFDDQGVFRLFLTTDVETGSIISNALDEARDRLFRAGQADVDWVDALRELADTSLDAASEQRRRRFRTNLHLDVDGVLTNAEQARLPDAARDHLLCDGTIDPVWVEAGRPVSIGRAQHVVPDRTRTVVEHRDGRRCRVPGCDHGRWLEVHHIVHWADGGATDTPNLLLICAHHHRQHHRGRLGISGDADQPDGVTFTNRRGVPIRGSGAAPSAPRGDPPEPAGVYRHPDGGRLDGRWLTFDEPTRTGRVHPRHRLHAVS